MKENIGGTQISKAAINRLPAYLRYLRTEASKGREYISSAVIAEDMFLSAVCVRKDLAFVSSVAGTPHKGFPIRTLINDLEKILGYHNRANAAVVGAGKLGRAILCYEGFEHFGIRIAAAFDVSPDKIGASEGKPIYPMSRLEEIVKRERISLCILTVPRSAAQEACDQLVQAGIQAILCFAATHLEVPDTVTVKYEDIASSLASLCGQLGVIE